jgi:autotransporter-associated beta strand protein
VNNIGGLTIPSISFVNGAGAFTISGSAVNLGSIANTSANSQTLSLGVIQSTSGTYNAASNITLSGSLSGSGNIVKEGVGTLALNGSSKSNYTGTVTVNDGTLSIGTAGMSNAGIVLGANTTLATTGIGGNLSLKSLEISGTNVTLPGNNLAFIGGGLTNSTGAGLTVSNNVAFSGATTIDAGVNGMMLTGAVAGSGTTTSIGSGVLELTNASNGFSGQFNVNSGTTRLASGVPADFAVATGAALESTVGGVGSVSTITLQDGSNLVPGGVGTIGSFTADTNVTLGSTSSVQFDIAGVGASDPGFGGTDFDQVNFASGFSNGVLTYAGFLDLNFTSSTTFEEGVSFLLFNTNDVGTFTGDLAGINTTTTTGASPYAGLTFASFSSFSGDEQAFLTTRFGAQAGDWISSWNGAGEQRLIFSQANGTLTVVPEPSTIVFAGIGLAMFGWSTWTRRRASARRQVLEALA